MHIKPRISFLVGFAVVITILFVYRYPLMNLGFVHLFTCSHSILSGASSPDGRYVATVFERNCGAVTPYTRVVSIRRGGIQFDGEDDRAWVFVMKDQPTIKIRWSGQRHLNIASEGYSRTSREQRLKTARWEDVEVVQEQP
jgi:hypothetical protein